MARRKAHGLDFARPARLSVGRARNAGPWRILREVRPRLEARHRGIDPLSRLRRPGLRGAVVPRRRLPGGRPGTWLRATHAGAASRPALTTPREVAPLGGRDGENKRRMRVDGQIIFVNDNIVMITRGASADGEPTYCVSPGKAGRNHSSTMAHRATRHLFVWWGMIFSENRLPLFGINALRLAR